MPLLLRLYLAFAAVSAPLWRLVLWRRQRTGREDPVRGREKLGYGLPPRPEGLLLWFHAVSVGEAQALVTLLDRLTAKHPAVQVLLTTHTLASVRALDARGLPPRVIHAYAPADYPGAVGRVLAHWRPDALIVAEADMWPVMLTRAHRAAVPMLLLNTHVTARRYRRRSRMAATNGYLMNLFERILVQDEVSMARFRDLGAPAAKMSVMGVLKAASDPLPDRPDERAALEAQIGGRPVWLAASTKVVEEPLLMQAQAMALQDCPDLLFLIAPRQRTEADRTETAARTLFTQAQIARRSRGEPITVATRVYIADTIGEMGLWYRLAPVAYTGNSLRVPGTPLTGKNPFEAIALGAMVVHGPDVGNFADAYARLKAAGGALEVADAAAMARAVVAAQDPDFRKPYLDGAARVQAENMHPLAVSLAAIEALIARIGPR
ncbi:3-deoxy-D-manno-octulosonic acid transferase [Pararhodobacter marinus]|uniref:3-deoxy-D-manno-octulosonic acid transferase n=1 Tax=Pararhodobacter marinus TaxID=2184063 RepID=A0A2U2CGB3_9RHOB|nr:glycosyltransferase N-terminal domain-containing protein [Pararhodobacter marinus]PWE30925.1 3-deoxy-D-manno-octulosonic acid transferase [Pararhodobacter marinus]